MSVTLTVSDETFQRLQIAAKSSGKENVEQLLEEWNDRPNDISPEELERRRKLGDEMRAFRRRMKEKYGVMQDSTPLIREDRER